MRVLIIKKTYKDSNRVSGPYFQINKLLPDNYPLSCEEKDYPSMGAAIKDNPGKTVMTTAAYNTFHYALEVSHKDKLDLMYLKQKELNLATALETGNV